MSEPERDETPSPPPASSRPERSGEPMPVPVPGPPSEPAGATEPTGPIPAPSEDLPGTPAGVPPAEVAAAADAGDTRQPATARESPPAEAEPDDAFGWGCLLALLAVVSFALLWVTSIPPSIRLGLVAFSGIVLLCVAVHPDTPRPLRVLSAALIALLLLPFALLLYLIVSCAASK